MASRLATAAVVISFLLGILWLDTHHPLAGTAGLWLFPLLLIILTLAALESVELLSRAGQAPSAVAVVVGVLAINIAVALPMLMEAGGWEYPANCPVGRAGLAAAGMGFGVLGICLTELLRYNPEREGLGGVTSGIFALAHVGLLGSFLILLRDLGSDEEGMAALLSVIIVTKVSDSGAYFVGRSFGKHKLAPRISPGKTVEGLVGGLLTGALASLLFFQVIVNWIVSEPFHPGLGLSLLYGIVLTIAGVIGDLSESLLKRQAKMKDSSRWLPGLGGVLDILDSLLFAALVAYAFWAAGLLSA